MIYFKAKKMVVRPRNDLLEEKPSLWIRQSLKENPDDLTAPQTPVKQIRLRRAHQGNGTGNKIFVTIW